MDRVAIKELAMSRGYCKAEYVDQLCERCSNTGQQCSYVPERTTVRLKKSIWTQLKKSIANVFARMINHEKQ